MSVEVSSKPHSWDLNLLDVTMHSPFTFTSCNPSTLQNPVGRMSTLAYRIKWGIFLHEHTESSGAYNQGAPLDRTRSEAWRMYPWTVLMASDYQTKFSTVLNTFSTCFTLSWLRKSDAKLILGVVDLDGLAGWMEFGIMLWLIVADIAGIVTQFFFPVFYGCR